MKCPVCKTELFDNAQQCVTCGFDDLYHEFISEDDAKDWMEQVVIPYRVKRNIFISDNEVLSSTAISPASQDTSSDVYFEYDSKASEPAEDLRDSLTEDNKNIHLGAKRIESKSLKKNTANRTGLGPLFLGLLCVAFSVFLLLFIITSPFGDGLPFGWTLFILLFLSIGYCGINTGLHKYGIHLKMGKLPIGTILYISAVIVILLLFFFKVELDEYCWYC